MRAKVVGLGSRVVAVVRRGGTAAVRVCLRLEGKMVNVGLVVVVER